MQTSAAANPDPMATFRTLGRLLGVGIAAGGLIGGFVGGLAAWSPSSSGYLVGGLSIGAGLDVVLGLITQAVTHAFVLAARRVRRASPSTSGTAVAAVVPLTAVAAVSLWVARISSDTTVKSVIIVGGATTLAAITVVLTLPWSLSPLRENFG